MINAVTLKLQSSIDRRRKAPVASGGSGERFGSSKIVHTGYHAAKQTRGMLKKL